MSKLVIFGTGQYCINRWTCFNDENVVAFADNNDNVVGKNIDGIPIVAAEKIPNLTFDVIYYICNRDD